MKNTFINRVMLIMMFNLLLLMSVTANAMADKGLVETTGDLPIELCIPYHPTEEELSDKAITDERIANWSKNPEYWRALNEGNYIEQSKNNLSNGYNSTFLVMPFPTEVYRGRVLDTANSLKSVVYRNTCSVPVRRQINWYYCGPATVKQLDDYFNGDRYTQTQIAGFLGTTTSGTDFTRVMQFLRDYVRSGYVLRGIGTFDNWHRVVVDSININRPAVIDINANGISSIPYNSVGHILNVSGYEFGDIPNRTRTTDPHPDFSGERWIPSYDLYNANNNHFRREMIY